MSTIVDPIDLLLDSDGDLVVGTDLQFSRGVEAVAQGIRVRVLTFKGEWFANLDTGVPYYQDLLGQKFDQIRAHAAYRDIILSTPNVESLISLVATFKRSQRTLVVTWEVLTAFGPVSDSVEVS